MLQRIRSWLRPHTDQARFVVALLCQAFSDNIRLRRLLDAASPQYPQKLETFFQYYYRLAARSEGVYLNPSQTTVLLFYRKKYFFRRPKDILIFIYLLSKVFDVTKASSLIYQERLISRIRRAHIRQQGDIDFLYIWFLAQKPDYKGISGLVEAKTYIISQAKRLQIPMYLEATSPTMVKVYQRMGVHFYHTHVFPGAFTIWFGRFPPPKSTSLS